MFGDWNFLGILCYRIINEHIKNAQWIEQHFNRHRKEWYDIHPSCAPFMGITLLVFRSVNHNFFFRLQISLTVSQIHDHKNQTSICFLYLQNMGRMQNLLHMQIETLIVLYSFTIERCKTSKKFVNVDPCKLGWASNMN